MKKTRAVQRSLPVAVFRSDPFYTVSRKIDEMLGELPGADEITIVAREHYDDGRVLLVGGPFMGREVMRPEGSEFSVPMLPDIRITEETDQSRPVGLRVAVYRRTLTDPDRYKFERIREL